MATNTVTLKLQGTSDLSKLTTDLRGVATQSKTAATSLKSATQQIDQTARSTQTFGQKIKSFGSNFGQLSGSVATLGSSVVNLNRQYQDLSDTQIRVDRGRLKLSRTTEAVRTAQQKLNEAIKKYGPNSAEAAKATLDLTQAQDAQKLSSTLLGEALEDQQRATEDFWMGLAPTVLSAGTTVFGIIQKLIGSKGGGGFTGLTDSIASASLAIGTGGKGGGGTGLLGKLGTLAPIVGGATAGAGGGLLLTAVGAQEQAALDKLTGVNQPGGPQRVSPFEMLLGDPKKRKEQIVAYEADIKVAQEATKRGLNLSGLDYLQDAFTNFFGGKSTIVEDKLKSVGLTAEVIQPAVKGLATGVGELSGEFTGLPPPVDAATSSLDAVVAPIEKVNTSLMGMAANIHLLDENLQPLPPVMQQLGDVMTQANASLTASGSGINLLAQATTNGVASANKWIATTEQQIATDTAFKDSIFQRAQAMYGAQVSTDMDVRVLQMMIEAQLLAKQGSIDLANAKLAEAKALDKSARGIAAWNTWRAKMVHLTNQIPTSGTLKGPRNPNYRLRSDYQRPILGSSLAQRQILAGTRKSKGGDIRTKTAQGGMHEFLHEDTAIMAHRGERVDIGKGGGGSHITISFLPAEFAQFLRYSINDNQGVMK